MEARQAEQVIQDRGGLTPRDIHTINTLSRVFEQIMLAHVTHALERPRNLWDCAYEMFAMEATGACRDQFSSFLPPVQARKRKQALAGTFGSARIEMEMQAGQVVVVTPLTDTAVAQTGIRPGDVITEVNDIKVESVAETLELLQGQPGTPVVLTVVRQDQQSASKELRFTLRREVMVLKTVKTRVVQKEYQALVGIVRIDEMHQNTVEQFREALDTLFAQHITHMVIDVRGNPGGSLNTAVRMLALFMDTEDTALVVRERNTERVFDMKFLTSEHGIEDYGMYRDLNIVVLIDGGSASAAEIFAGALQDWGYTIVGERSFGKGVAQSLITLYDDSMFLLSTFEFMVGNHHVPIRNRGVQPNIEVKNLHPAHDEQLEKAIETVLTSDKARITQH
jgi:carboxyl-terminal processing protease